VVDPGCAVPLQGWGLVVEEQTPLTQAAFSRSLKKQTSFPARSLSIRKRCNCWTDP